MTRPRLVLADDHKIVLEGLRSLLEPDFELVATVADGESLVKAAEELRPDVVVADISMPRLNGIEAARQIQKLDPAPRIVFLTMHPDPTYATAAVQAGASGYVLKHSAPDELVTAIREALAGRMYITPLVIKDVMSLLLDSQGQPSRASHRLTPRQLQVLRLVAEGMSAKQVANALNISHRTVEFHKYRMMRALGVRSGPELIHYAIRHGLTSV